ncbi:MAG: hypothetical protein A2020_05135 [Lentisphaerae bacterium GWF2_45_14]|nr:MAG: hypothetical protein A2020_05135 [Lentisphaerae bacterium GWF2_45_14]
MGIGRFWKNILPTALCLITIPLSAGHIAAERLNYKIITPDNPSAVCRTAASELNKILEKTYDAPIKLNGDESPVIFFAGVSSEAIMAGFTDLPDIDGRFGIFRKGRNILFYGFDDKGIDPEKDFYGEAGTLLSVYYFLNKYAGAGFYFPGENGYSVTKEKPISFESAADLATPTFVLRGFSMMTGEFSSLDKMIFSRRMLCSIPRWAHHDIYYIYWNNWKKRFQDIHPEYFMLMDGKRISEKYPNHVPCFSNQEVIKQTVADIVEDLNRNPSKTTVKIFCDAPINLCQCEKCKAMNESQSVSEAVYGFQKKIADIIHQSHPGIYFLTQTKGHSYYEPPKLVKLDHSFTVNILASPHLTDLKYQEFALENAKKWKNAGVRTFIFGYPRFDDIPTKNMPVITPRFTSEYLKAFRGITTGTYTSELRGNPYSFSALNQFVLAKLLFDLDSDVDKLIEEFCVFAYPGAEKEICEFYAEMEKLYRQRKDVFINPFSDIYYVNNLEKPMRLLDEAREKTESPFFNKLYEDFKIFYNRSLSEKDKTDAWNAKQKIRLQATEKPVKLPCAEEPVDINLSPDKWKNAVALSFSAPHDIKNFQNSSAYLVRDGSYLYLGLVAFEKNIPKRVANCKDNHTGPLWSDDSFEFMLVPPDQKSYYQIIVNSNGFYRVLLPAEGKDASDFKIETKASLSLDKWTACMKIPLSQFKKNAFRHPWKFNVFRNRFCGEAVQYSGIRMLGRNFHLTETYAVLLWPDALANNQKGE